MPVRSTMNEAPKRDPESTVSVCRLVRDAAPKRLIAVAAIGEPDSTKYAPSQPVPRVETPFANGNCPWIEGPSADAPAFINWIARMNRNIAGRKNAIFL